MTQHDNDKTQFHYLLLCFVFVHFMFYVWHLSAGKIKLIITKTTMKTAYVHTIHMTSSAKTSVTRNLLNRLGAVLMVSLKVKRNLNFLRCSVFRYFETSYVYEDC